MCTCQEKMGLRILARCALRLQQGGRDSDTLVPDSLEHLDPGMLDVYDDDFQQNSSCWGDSVKHSCNLTGMKTVARLTNIAEMSSAALHAW